MVISDKHRYVFVELPHTGSSAIRRELVDQYDGQLIHWKHAYYSDFIRHARPEQLEYFVFSCIRNPLDEAVSVYLKLKHDHNKNFTTPKRWQRNGGWVSDRKLRGFEFIRDNQADFSDYFRAFFGLPYDNWSSLDHHRFDFVIRFENLAQDFETALVKIGLSPQRSLPVVNATEGKRSFETFYTPDVYQKAAWVFGPFMQKWRYTFPPEWGIDRCPLSARLMYDLLARSRNVYRRYIDPQREQR